MSLDRVKAHLEEKGYADRIIIPEHSSATVAEAAEVASELIVRSCKVDPELKVVVCCASEKDARAYCEAIGIRAGA